MEFGWINVWGTILVIIMLIPNIIFAIRNPHSGNKCRNFLVNMTEQIGRYASMALMILPIGIWEFGFRSVFEMLLYFIATAALLTAYLVVWVFYFRAESACKAIALALLPTSLFLVSGILLRHWLLVIAAILFGAAHTYITTQNQND
ncbi:MAG: hypothetical protein LUI05_06960 [Oscillospiraceae bacterium]|nr:hypothetical protein [Oscillospiraceae bacterium]